MKIAVIASGRIPSQWAHSINTMKHAQGFYKLGYNVEILTVERLKEFRNRLVIKNIQDFYDINQKITIRYFKDYIYFFFLKDFPTIRLYIERLIPKIIKRFDPELKISKFCEKEKIDLAYCRAYRAPYYNIKKKIPTIVEIHNPDLKNKELLKLLKLSKNEFFKVLVTISEILKKKFIDNGVPREKIVVLEDAVDLKKFLQITKNKKELRSELGLPLNKKIIMYCGSLKRGKGIGKILETAKLFDTKVQFFIIGGNKKEIRYWKKQTSNSKINNIVFLSFIKNKLIPKYLKCADILFMPYDLNEKSMVMDINTTSPMKLFEYMASKNPIISTKIPTIEKIVEHKKEAYLADPYDIDETVKYIKILLDDENIASQLINNAYRKVINHTYNIRCKKILNNID